MKRLIIPTLAVLLFANCGNATNSNKEGTDSASQSTEETTLVQAEKTPISPYTLEGIKKALERDDFDFDKYVYIFEDVDGDGTPEMFIREKVKDYNEYFALCIGSGKPELIFERESGGVEEFQYGDGFLFHYGEHTGGMSTLVKYYILEKSKVKMTLTSSYYCDWSNWKEDDPEPVPEEEWMVERDGKVISTKEADYNKYVPEGGRESLYNLDGWKSFPASKADNKKSDFDVLQKSGRISRELVPSDWENVSIAEGDLNKDGKKDLVILGLPTYKENMKTREDGYVYNFNSPVIGIYLRDKDDFKYELFAQSDNIIPAMDEFMSIEEMSVEIKSNGVLWIKYQDFHSAGTADVNTTTYLYRFQDGDFYLIGEENKGFSRYTHATETTSYNYLTNKRVTTIKKEEGASPKPKTEAIEKKPLRKFSE